MTAPSRTCPGEGRGYRVPGGRCRRVQGFSGGLVAGRATRSAAPGQPRYMPYASAPVARARVRWFVRGGQDQARHPGSPSAGRKRHASTTATPSLLPQPPRARWVARLCACAGGGGGHVGLPCPTPKRHRHPTTDPKHTAAALARAACMRQQVPTPLCVRQQCRYIQIHAKHDVPSCNERHVRLPPVGAVGQGVRPTSEATDHQGAALHIVCSKPMVQCTTLLMHVTPIPVPCPDLDGPQQLARLVQVGVVVPRALCGGRTGWAGGGCNCRCRQVATGLADDVRRCMHGGCDALVCCTSRLNS